MDKVLERKIMEATERLQKCLVEMEAVETELAPILEKKRSLQRLVDALKIRVSMLEKKR